MRKESAITVSGLGDSLWRMGWRDEGNREVRYFGPVARKVEEGAGVINTTCGLISSTCGRRQRQRAHISCLENRVIW